MSNLHEKNMEEFLNGNLTDETILNHIDSLMSERKTAEEIARELAAAENEKLQLERKLRMAQQALRREQAAVKAAEEEAELNRTALQSTKLANEQATASREERKIEYYRALRARLQASGYKTYPELREAEAKDEAKDEVEIVNWGGSVVWKSRS